MWRQSSYVTGMCASWQKHSIADRNTYTSCWRSLLIPAVTYSGGEYVEFSVPHRKVTTRVTASVDLSELPCMTVHCVSLLASKSCPSEDTLGPEVRVLMDKQGASPCWHQTDWHQMEPCVSPQEACRAEQLSVELRRLSGRPRASKQTEQKKKKSEQTSNRKISKYRTHVSQRNSV